MKTMLAMLQLTFVVLAAMIVSPCKAQAGIIATDDFSYPDAPFTGQNGGTGIWLTQWVGFGFVVDGEQVDGTQSLPANFNEASRFIDRGFGSSPPPATPLLFVAFDLSTPESIELDDFAGVRLTFGANGNILTLGKLPGSNEFLVGAGGLRIDGHHGPAEHDLSLGKRVRGWHGFAVDLDQSRRGRFLHTGWGNEQRKRH